MSDFLTPSSEGEFSKRVVICTPTLTKPYDVCVKSITASTPLLKQAGWDAGFVFEVGCPYISNARATMTRKALDKKADVIVYIDHDLSWDAQDLLTLIETPGDVVAGLYRFKEETEHYMGVLSVTEGPPENETDSITSG